MNDQFCIKFVVYCKDLIFTKEIHLKETLLHDDKVNLFIDMSVRVVFKIFFFLKMNTPNMPEAICAVVLCSRLFVN